VARRFPGVLYVAPEPDEAFRRLTTEVWNRYPETPPYGGKYHERQLDDIAAELLRASEGKLPISAAASEMALPDTTSGRWRVRATFKLGTPLPVS
jgi:hypothetical protein